MYGSMHRWIDGLIDGLLDGLMVGSRDALPFHCAYTYFLLVREALIFS